MTLADSRVNPWAPLRWKSPGDLHYISAFLLSGTSIRLLLPPPFWSLFLSYKLRVFVKPTFLTSPHSLHTPLQPCFRTTLMLVCGITRYMARPFHRGTHDPTLLGNWPPSATTDCAYRKGVSTLPATNGLEDISWSIAFVQRSTNRLLRLQVGAAHRAYRRRWYFDAQLIK